MKRPTWVTIVGVLGIIFGIFGLLGAAHTITMPKTMQMQKELFSKLEKAPQANPEKMAQMNQAFKVMDKMWGNVPGWFAPATLVLGLLGLLVNALYIYTAIALLQVKKFAIKLFYAAIALTIGYAVLRLVVFALAFTSFIGISMQFGAIAGIVLDLILLIVVVTGDKRAFSQEAVALVTAAVNE